MKRVIRALKISRLGKFAAAALTLAALIGCAALFVPAAMAADRTLGNYIINGQVRVQTYSDTLVRVEMKGTDGQFHNEMTYLIANHAGGDKTNDTLNYALWQKNEDWPGAAVISAGNAGGNFEIVTAAYIVDVPLDATSLSGVTVKDPQGNVIYSFAASGVPTWNTFRSISTGGLPGPGETPQAWAAADSPRVYPAKWGYDPMPGGTVDPLDQNGWVTDNDVPDVYVFVPKGDGRQLLSDFVALTGRGEMIPLKSFGLWQSKYWDISAQDAVDTVNKYHTEGFPLDTFVTDVDWKSNHSNGYDWNTTTFLKPGGPATTPEQYFGLMNSLKVDSVFNDHPEPQPRPASGSHIDDPDALTSTDLNYRNDNLKKILGQGLTAWWYDRNWSCTIRSPFDPNNVNQATQQIPEQSFGSYLYTWITASYYDSVRQKNGDAYAKRPLVMSNVTGIDNGSFNYYPDLASHRWSIQWTGDTHATSGNLYNEITNVARLGAEAAFAYMSSDLTGHMDVVTPGQYVRWVQYGALSPIMRFHCTANKSYWREPWLYGTAAENAAREYIDMRYRLLPLFYSLSHENYATGLPIDRRLDFNYPKYNQARSDTEYTLGNNILQAPLWNWTDGVTSAAPASWFTYNGAPGLYTEYYNNNSLTEPSAGNAVNADINIDWGTGGPGNGVTGTDNFSLRWSGKLTPAVNCYITAVADDGIRVFINGAPEIDEWHASDSNTYYGKTMLLAGQTYDFTVEYYEATGNAKCIIGYQAAAAADAVNSRSVFIPDGTWTDVWTGEAFTGPKTITASKGFATSPLYVREGTIVPLAKSDGVENIEQQVPWSDVALDVYPSARLNDTEKLYEDDLNTVGYKDGQYRETPLKLTFDSVTSEAVVNIGPAAGGFSGAIANRSWKVRVHQPAGWGAVLGVTLDGAAVTDYKTYPKDASGKAFNFTGASPEADVYEITIPAGSVAQGHEVRVKFASVYEEEPGGDTPTTTTQKFASLELITNTIDLSTGAADWLRIGKEGGSMHYIRGNATLINNAYPLTVNGHKIIPWAGDFSDINQVVDYNGGSAVGSNGSAGNGGGGGGVSYSGPTNPGDSFAPFSNTADQHAVQVTGVGGSVQIDVPSSTDWRLLKVYLGAWNSTNTITIWDDLGAEPTVLQYNAGGTVQIRALNVYYRSPTPGTLHVKEAQTSGSGNISLAGYSIFETGKSQASAAITVDSAPVGYVTLSDAKNQDWIHFGMNGAANTNQKSGGSVFTGTAVQSLIPVISGVSDGLQGANDFGASPAGGYFRWTGGTPTDTAGTSAFAYSFRGMRTEVNIPAGIWKLSVYSSIWWGKGQFIFLDSSGKVIDSVDYVSATHANGQSDYYKINVIYDSPSPGTITIKNMPALWPNDSHAGNQSIAAMTIEKAIDHISVAEQNPDVLKTLTAKVFATPDDSQEFYTYDGVTFQWASGDSAAGPWTDIAGASARTFQPTRAQAGKYLRVSATYAGTTVYYVLQKPVAPMWNPAISGNMVTGTFYNDGTEAKSLQLIVAYYDADNRLTNIAASGFQQIAPQSSFDYYQLIGAVPDGVRVMAYLFDPLYAPGALPVQLTRG